MIDVFWNWSKYDQIIILPDKFACTVFKCQFCFMFQSEPEEMPPEAKMRMKNIGRLDFILIQLNFISIVSYSIVWYNTVLLTTF